MLAIPHISREIEVIGDLASRLAAADGLRAGCEAIVETVANCAGARTGFIVLKKTDTAVADLMAAYGIGAADFRRLESRVPKSTLWQVFRLAKPLAIDDLGRDAGLSHLAFGTGARMLIAVPILFAGQTEGFLAVAFSPQTRVPEEQVIAFLTAVAALIGQAMKTERARDERGRRIEAENVNLKQELRGKYKFANLIGNSSAIRQVYLRVTRIARSNDAVLLRGESGTGKELLANTIHHNSLRARRAFVHVNCAGQDDGMLFENVAGKKSLFERADGGTIYLDEIGSLAAASQLRLLGILNQTDFKAMLQTNVRVIAATSSSLEDAAADGDFRDDLLQRLAGFSITVPPLRERKTDILPLAEFYLDKYQREHDKDIRRLSTPAIDLLSAYHFPGNIRELESVIERAVIACDANVVHGHHLPPTLQTAELSGTETRLNLALAIETFESDMIQDALKSTGGNVTRAAKMLDSTERILGYKIKKYNISPARFRRWKSAEN